MPPRQLPAGTRVCLDGTVWGTLVRGGAAGTADGHYSGFVMPDTAFELMRGFDLDDVDMSSLRDCAERPEERVIQPLTVACSYCKAPAGSPCVKVMSHTGPPPEDGHIIRHQLAADEAARQSAARAPSPGEPGEDQSFW